MPLVGRAGAIAAANRRNRQRSSSAGARAAVLRKAVQEAEAKRTSSKLDRAATEPAKAMSFDPPARNAEPDVQQADVMSFASVSSKMSIMSRFKQTVQEKAQKAQSALSRGMSDSIVKGKTLLPKGSVLKSKVQSANSTSTSALDAADFALGAQTAALEDMGFSAADIHDAVKLLEPGATAEDLLQMLLVISSGCEPAIPEASQPKASVTVEPQASAAPDVMELESEVVPDKPGEEQAVEFVTCSAVGSADYESVEDKSQILSGPSAIVGPQLMTSLKQMGFTADAIHQAAINAGKRASIDELLQVLLRSGSPTACSAKAMKQDGLNLAAASAVGSAEFEMACQEKVPQEDVDEAAESHPREIARAIICYSFKVAAAKSLQVEEAKEVEQQPEATKRATDSPSAKLGHSRTMMGSTSPMGGA